MHGAAGLRLDEWDGSALISVQHGCGVGFGRTVLVVVSASASAGTSVGMRCMAVGGWCDVRPMGPRWCHAA